MGFIGSLFNTILYQPLFNALIILYVFLPGHDFGLSIIILTAVIRIILFPLMAGSIRAQKVLSEIQPKLKEIQQKFKDDRERQMRETMALYRENKINPFGSLLPLLVQLPILFALYRVFWKGLNPGEMANLYGFVPNPGSIDPTFLGIVDLAQPSLILALLAGAAQFFQAKMMTKRQQKPVDKNDRGANISNMMSKQMLYFFPLFTVLILWKLPAAIGLYWITTSLFTILQQYLILKKQNNSPNVQSR